MSPKINYFRTLSLFVVLTFSQSALAAPTPAPTPYTSAIVAGPLNATSGEFTDLVVHGHSYMKKDLTIYGDLSVDGSCSLKGNVLLGDGSESSYEIRGRASRGQAMPMFLIGAASAIGQNYTGGDVKIEGGRSGLSFMHGGDIYINAGDAYRPSVHDDHNYGEIFIGTSSGKVQLGNPTGATFFQGSTNIMGTLAIHGSIETSMDAIEATIADAIASEGLLGHRQAMRFKSGKGNVIISGETPQDPHKKAMGEDAHDTSYEGGNVQVTSGGSIILSNNGTGLSMHTRRSNKQGQLCCYLKNGTPYKAKNATHHYAYPDAQGKCPSIDYPHYFITQVLAAGDVCAVKTNYIDFHTNEKTFMRMSADDSTKRIEVSAPMTLDSFAWTMSDQRVMLEVKETNVEQSLEIIDELQLREYKLTDAYASATGVQAGVTMRGFVADEVDVVYKQHTNLTSPVSSEDRSFAVEGQGEMKIEGMKQLNYDAIYMDMFNAVKALIAKKDQLTQELAGMKADIEAGKAACTV